VIEQFWGRAVRASHDSKGLWDALNFCEESPIAPARPLGSDAHILVQKIPQKNTLLARKILKPKDRRFPCLLDLWFLR
jgi:hypothetical protein